MPSALRVRVVVPHYFREVEIDNEGGYGSERGSSRLARVIAFGRCLGSILAQRRASREWILNIAETKLELSAESELSWLRDISIELHLFVCGDHWLNDAVEIFRPWLTLHCLKLDDPRELPLTAVRQLLDMPDPAHLSLYMEDDLVIDDPHFFDMGPV